MEQRLGHGAKTAKPKAEKGLPPDNCCGAVSSSGFGFQKLINCIFICSKPTGRGSHEDCFFIRAAREPNARFHAHGTRELGYLGVYRHGMAWSFLKRSSGGLCQKTCGGCVHAGWNGLLRPMS